MNKIRSMLAAMVLALAGLSMVLVQPVMATATCPAGTIRAGQSVNSLTECNVEDDNSLMPTIYQIINVVLGVLGIAAVIMIILGAVNYITSSGDAAKITKARNTILYGVIGLVIALLAFAIVNFVLVSVF